MYQVNRSRDIKSLCSKTMTNSGITRIELVYVVKKIIIKLN